MSELWSFLNPAEVLFGQSALARLAESVRDPCVVVVTDRRPAAGALAKHA